jgi:hypothetical protein
MLSTRAANHALSHVLARVLDVAPPQADVSRLASRSLPHTQETTTAPMSSPSGALWLLRSFAGGFPRPRPVERRAGFSFRQSRDPERNVGNAT